MPRRTREEGPGAIHHVVPQGNNRSRIVHDDSDRVAFLHEIRTAARRFEWITYAESLLDTHYHGMFETPEPTLGHGMRLALGRYAARVNNRRGREGHVFGHRYWSVRVKTVEHLICGAVYIVINPVVAGLCSHPREWPWSSYHQLVEGETAGPRLLLMLGLDEEQGRRRLLELIDEAVERSLAVRAKDARGTWDAVAGALEASGWGGRDPGVRLKPDPTPTHPPGQASA